MNVDGHEKPQEACAVFGVSLTTGEAAGITYNGLLALQHRGQESAGIAVPANNHIVCHKDMGLVSEVFTPDVLHKLPPSGVAIGHTRYSTTGGNTPENAGPFVADYLTGRIAAAHNGNITNAKALRNELEARGLRFLSSSDSEIISALIAYCITQRDPEDFIAGVTDAAGRLEGAFSLAIACGKGKLVALRDPHGFRPLCLGQNKDGFAVASESCALAVCGFDWVRDIAPGELIAFENGKIVHQERALSRASADCGLCIFEYVYFARSDSVIDGLSVYAARYGMGQALAEEYPVDADVVCGVPDSGLEAASGYSAASGIPLAPGFVKNRYIGRSFIYPTQSQRDSAVLQKLNPLAANIKGKRVVLVDDSIVRGTTSEKIVKSLKKAGAAEVHMRVSSPPFRYTCHYGTDIDSEENLIANQISLGEIRDKIGADSLGFISIAGLKRACGKCALPFCAACFTGVGAVGQGKKDMFE